MAYVDGWTDGRTDGQMFGRFVGQLFTVTICLLFFVDFFLQRDNVVRPTTIIGRIADDIQHNLR